MYGLSSEINHAATNQRCGPTKQRPFIVLFPFFLYLYCEACWLLLISFSCRLDSTTLLVNLRSCFFHIPLPSLLRPPAVLAHNISTSHKLTYTPPINHLSYLRRQILACINKAGDMVGTSFSRCILPGSWQPIYPSINVSGILGLQRVFGEQTFRWDIFPWAFQSVSKRPRRQDVSMAPIQCLFLLACWHIF